MTENKGGVKYGNMSEIGMSKEGKGFNEGRLQGQLEDKTTQSLTPGFDILYGLMIN